MNRENTITYDVCIVGGGLAGLALSIQLANAGYEVALFEKEKYPFHKVCGEYISFENWNFLEELGLPLSDWNLPVIKRLKISSPNGNYLESDLALGGFGISRYKIDAALADIARSVGVHLFEEHKVTDIMFEKNNFHICTSAVTFNAKVVCGSFGKRTNLDVRWKRNFTRKKNSKLNNYIGVKYHIKTKFPPDLIALHNFQNGYCGISQIEANNYCLCYLTTAENLRISNNSIAEMEKNILRRNPFLETIFSSSTFLFEQPVTISQISFERKQKVENHVLMIGDAAGMITPLCGNGMSMALHGSKIACKYIITFLKNEIIRAEMEQQYTDEWNKCFSKRVFAGRIIQRFFGSEFLSNILIRILRPFPKFISYLIRLTHGTPY
ncbi:MAG: NAD(P)/FAD-dependent oxidoreductase [Bacteroidetes bacterium]|nr:NAD(P)/FAD-dependent oxidoreductase [Bacteroidota bacterium]